MWEIVLGDKCNASGLGLRLINTASNEEKQYKFNTPAYQVLCEFYEGFSYKLDGAYNELFQRIFDNWDQDTF